MWLEQMKIGRKAVAGTLESSDVFVEVAPGSGGITIDIQSVVYEQFGGSIEETIRDVLRQNGVEAGSVTVNDKGALECTIRARVETAIKRGKGEL